MKVKELSAQNFKGASFDTSLSGREIFIGPNGSGKSTYLEALTLLLSGYLPKIGKTTDAILQLSTGEHLTVGGVLNDGYGFSRIHRRAKTTHKDQSVTHTTKTEHSLTRPQGESKDAERKRAIEKAVGSFSIMFDLDEFLGMSDTKKRDFVFSLSSPDKLGWDKNRILQGTDSAHHSWIEERWDNAVSIADNLSDMVSKLTRDALDARAILRSQTSLRDQALDEKQAAQMEEHEDPKVIEEQLEGLREQKLEIEKSMAGAQQTQTTRQSLINRRGELEAELITVEKVSERLPDIQECQKARTVAEGELLIMNGGLNLMTAARINLLQAEEEKRKEYEEAAKNLSDCTDAEKELNAKIGTIDGVVIPLLHEIMGNDATEQDLRAGMFDKLQDTVETFADQAKSLRDTINKTHKPMHDEAHEASSLAALAAKKADDGLSKEKQKIQLKEAELNQRRFEATDAERRHEEHANALANLREAKAKNQQLIDATAATIGLGAADMLTKTLSDQIASLNERLKKARKAQHLEHQFQKCVANIAECEDLIESTMELATALGPKGLQSKIMKDVVGPIRESVNGLLKKHGYEIEFNMFDRNGREVFEIFKIENSVRVPYLTLSGGEKILFGAALVVALIQLADPPVKALCIEAAELDANNFEALVMALDDVGGGLDNVMLASCNERVADMQADLEENGWRVHNLGAPVTL